MLSAPGRCAPHQKAQGPNQTRENLARLFVGEVQLDHSTVLFQWLWWDAPKRAACFASSLASFKSAAARASHCSAIRCNRSRCSGGSPSATSMHFRANATYRLQVLVCTLRDPTRELNRRSTVQRCRDGTWKAEMVRRAGRRMP